jgi:hypothetical protein
MIVSSYLLLAARSGMNLIYRLHVTDNLTIPHLNTTRRHVNFRHCITEVGVHFETPVWKIRQVPHFWKYLSSLQCPSQFRKRHIYDRLVLLWKIPWLWHPEMVGTERWSLDSHIWCHWRWTRDPMGQVLKLQVSHIPFISVVPMEGYTSFRNTFLAVMHASLELKSIFCRYKICYCRAAQTQWQDVIFSVLC